MAGSPEPRALAQLLDARAHALRNDIATLRSAAQVLEDRDLAADLDAAARSLQRAVEQAVVAARVELGAAPDPMAMDAAELLGLGVRRARREGTTRDVDLTLVVGIVVTGPAPWTERLVADLLHLADADAAIDCGVRNGGVHLCAPAAEPPAALLGYLEELAAACGATVEVGAGRISVTLADV